MADKNIFVKKMYHAMFVLGIDFVSKHTQIHTKPCLFCDQIIYKKLYEKFCEHKNRLVNRPSQLYPHSSIK